MSTRPEECKSLIICVGTKSVMRASSIVIMGLLMCHTKIEHIVAENDLVVVFLNGSGTHAGEFRGKPPTNKRVNIRSADLYKIENEKIVEHWDVVDQLNLLHQTGTTLS